MGGGSSSTFATLPDPSGSGLFGSWTGTIVTKNGGFCGVRSRNFQLDAGEYEGFEVTVRGGDGQKFKFITRDTDDWNGIAWTWTFGTRMKGEVTKVRMPFSTARPTKFARTVKGVTLNKRSLRSLQFTLSQFDFDGELNSSFNGDGPFGMDVVEVAFY